MVLLAIFQIIFVQAKAKMVIRHGICIYHSTMKHIAYHKQLKNTFIEWMLIKGPELFIAIYGK